MAPRKRSAVQLAALTNVMHMLHAIIHKLGKLDSVEAQNALAEKVITTHNLDITAVKLRATLFRAVSSYRLTETTRGEDAFKKKPSEVFTAEYIKDLNQHFSMMKGTTTRSEPEPEEENAQPEQEKPLPRLKWKKSGTVTAAVTSEAGEEMMTATGSAKEVVEETAPRRSNSADSHGQSSADVTQDVETVVSRFGGSGDTAPDVPDDSDPVDAGLQETPTEARPTLQSPSGEARPVETDRNLVTDISSLAKSSGDQQPTDHDGRRNEVLEARQEDLKVAQAAIIDLRAQLEQSQRHEKTAKKRIEDLEAQARSSTNKKRSSTSPEPPAKRHKSDIAHLQKDGRRNISEDMIGLLSKLELMVTNYFLARKLSHQAWVELNPSPSPELEGLYTLIFQSKSGAGWRKAQATTQFRAYRTMMRLIAAHVFQSVFLEQLPWDKKAASAEKMACLKQYLDMDLVDKMMRDAAFRRINDKSFQDGEVARYAEKLALTLSIILAPFLNGLVNGKARSECIEWIDDLAEIYRSALIIKTKVDTYDGEIEAFWPNIGNKMDPVTMDPPGKMRKHLPHEICGVEWAGLKLKVEGEEDIILARAQVAAMEIQNK